MRKSFFAILAQFPSANITFRELNEDGSATSVPPTRYGRPLFGKYVQIVAQMQDGTQVLHPMVTLSEEVYVAISETGSRTND